MSASNLGWALVVTILAGCGGATFVEPDGGSTSDGGPGGGDGGVGTDSGIFACPATPPTLGSACPAACGPGDAPCRDIQCEYGTSPIGECNALYTCTGTWSADTRGNDPQVCTPSTKGCPATRASVPVGMACSPSPLECDYPEGRCACAISGFGPVRVDAGSEWICETPQADCPTPRPLAGTPCPKAGQSCDYGSCFLPGGDTLECDDGIWQSRPTLCPG